MSLAEQKARRRRRILQILQKQPVSSQEELLRFLHADNIPATQATVSRDLRAIGSVRTPSGYTLPGAGSATPPPSDGTVLRDALRTLLVSADRAGTVVVLRTAPGHASALATEFDASRMSAVVGTIAGDDTIFAACRSNTSAASLLRQIRELAALG